MRIRKARNVLISVLAFALLVIGAVSDLEADNLSIQEHLVIAPRSIPVPESGNASFAVTRLQFRNGSNFDADTNISRIDFQVNKTGALSYADIASVKAYFEPQGGAGTYDNERLGGDDLDIMTGSSYDTGTGAGYITFQVAPLSVPPYPASDAADFGWGASAHIYVVLEIANTADDDSSVSCEITSVTYGPVGDGTGSTAPPTALVGGEENLDTYRVDLTATGITTGDKDQASTNAPVLELELTTADSSAADIDLDSIKLHSLGDRDADIAAAGVLLYEDVDDDDSFEPGADDGEALASGSLSGGYVTLNPPLDLIFTPTTTRRFFVAVNVSLTAVVGNTIELEVENPSTDFTFKDIIYDDNQGVLDDYAYVFLGYPYVQEGYLTGTTPTPAAGNSFDVTELYVPTPPTVSSIVPGDGATGILRDTVVTAEFSEAMDATTIVSPTTNFILFIDNNSNSTYDAGDTNIPGTVSYNAVSKMATFDPDSDLEWTTTYTATVTTGVKDDNDGLNMTLDRIWVFSTQVAVYPIVSSTSPAAYDTGVLPGAVITADFSKDMLVSTIVSPATSFILFVDNNFNSVFDAGDTNIPGTVGYNVGTRQATFAPSSPLDPGTVYTATITTGAQSTDGLNLQADKVWSFFTSLRPVVLSQVPGDEAQGISRSTTVTATFSKNMDSGTITTTSFNLLKGVIQVDGSVSYDAPTRTATFTPSADLDWGSTYTVTITTAVADTDGINPPSDTVWTFDTVAAINPVVSNTSPAPDMTGVLPDAVVVATFSKDMKASTITGSTFLLKDQADTPVTGSVSFDGTREATFTPSSLLQTGLVYTATITTALEDTDDLSLLTDKVWSFETTSRPFVASVTPPQGTTGVNRATTIRATFSKDMKASTIDSPATNFIVFIDNNSNSTYDAGTDTVIPGSVTYDAGTYTATFTPDSDLGYSAYTATITTGVEDPDGIAMAASKTWGFSTVPTLNEPLVAGNRIVSGGNQQALIFVTEPPGGPSARVSVQVFTTSGRRVVTLVNNLPFSSISVPIIWDGTNGRGEKLGPGLYFVQIRAASYKRVLKVMIVR